MVELVAVAAATATMPRLDPVVAVAPLSTLMTPSSSPVLDPSKEDYLLNNMKKQSKITYYHTHTLPYLPPLAPSKKKYFVLKKTNL